MNDYLKWGAWLDIFIGDNGIQRRSNLVSYLKTFENPKNINSFIDQLIFTHNHTYNKLINSYNKYLQERSKILSNNLIDESWLKELEKNIEQAKQENQQMQNEQSDYQEQEERIVEKQKQVQELFEQVMTDEMKEMFKELETMLEKLMKDELQEMLQEMKRMPAQMPTQFQGQGYPSYTVNTI